MAPVERRLKRLLTRRGRSASCPEETEPVIETVRERYRRERVDARGRELECQWQSVKAMTDAGDRRRRLGVEREPWCHSTCPLDKQAHCLVAKQGIWRVLAGRIRNPERRNPEDDLAGNAQGLAARGENGEPGRTSE